MKAITEKSYTRITLALDIIRKIPDGPFRGYHELSIIKHPIGLFDVITVEESETTRIVCDNPSVPIDKNNICLTVLDRIRTLFAIDANVTITIEKNIPVMGGLAGGSANAATMLTMLDKLWGLHLTVERMIEIGRAVGMDVPFFFLEKTALDTEAGGVLEPIPTSCSFDFLLVVPPFGVSTKEAYATIDYRRVGKNSSSTDALKRALMASNASGVINNVHNDFELSVFSSYPELARIKQRLLDLGCTTAFMTGSGSTIAGIIDRTIDGERIRKSIEWKTLLVSSKT